MIMWFYIESENILLNPRLKRSYAVVEGIPVMLIEESTHLTDVELARLESRIAAEGIKPTFTR
jgi:uncharacterized protein